MITIQEIKRLIIIALASDDQLVETLVLKGGNAIDYLYKDQRNKVSRSSYDMDFSMEDDFNDDIELIEKRIKDTIVSTFLERNLTVFDFKFQIRPSKINDEISKFWGGYNIEFKLTTREHFDLNKSDLNRLSRTAISVLPNGSPKIEIEISKYEFVGAKKAIEVDGYLFFIYSEEMIVFEKVRAICQQLPEYSEVIPSHSSRPRARDFYDIYVIMNDHEISPNSERGKEMLTTIFEAKRVPLSYIKNIRNNLTIHRQDWQNVLDTIPANVDGVKDFDFYAEFVLAHFEEITFP